MKTLVIRLKNDVNGNPRYKVKFNYMTELNKKAFRKTKVGFNFSTYERVQDYLAKNVERFNESQLIIVNKEKDFHF